MKLMLNSHLQKVKRTVSDTQTVRPFSCTERGLGFLHRELAHVGSQSQATNLAPNDILVVNTLKGSLDIEVGYSRASYRLDAGDSLTLFYPMGEWKANYQLGGEETEVLLLRIDVLVLHSFLTGESGAGYREVMKGGYFPGGKGKSAEVITLPPQARLALMQVVTPPVGINSLKAWTRAKVTEFFALALDGKKEKIAESKCPFLQHGELFEHMKTFRAELISTMDENITSEYATKLGISAHALRGGFKRTFGKSVRDFCQEVRLDHAMELLQTTDYNVSEVAYQIGYSNPSHFIAAFKKRFGDTPAVFAAKKLGVKTK
ncbi:MAG: AraC family transcriptional regulator [Saprospirales bacterium]|nr:MAG: AraC family transcriptional regulator [Saprospirales bacterium]